MTLFAHIIGALLLFTGIWGMRDASASTTYPPPTGLSLHSLPSERLVKLTRMNLLVVAPHFGIPDATKEMLFSKQFQLLFQLSQKASSPFSGMLVGEFTQSAEFGTVHRHPPAYFTLFLA